MNLNDRKIGIDRPISRRDFINGVTATVALAATPSSMVSSSISAALEQSSSYPPALTGMRGNHDGSFDAAHKLAMQGITEWGTATDSKENIYDLIIVGGGISGLAAAHFYRKKKPDARILILDNHDDFGGHAKRNEFQVGDKTVLGHGGSQTMVNPRSYPKAARMLLTDLGIDLDKFDTAYDQQFYQKHGLRSGLHFDRKRWGVDKTVPLEISLLEDYIPVAKTEQTLLQSLAQMPISDKARQQLHKLMTRKGDVTANIPDEQKWRYLSSISYKKFLVDHVGITEQDVFDILQNLTSDSGRTIDTQNAFSALYYAGMPGWAISGLAGYYDVEYEPYICHFPDGNASIARMLVRSMIPNVASGNTMEDIVQAKFDYSQLDRDDNSVNIRLNSTVVHVKHDHDSQASVTYVRNNASYEVKGKHVILACYNSMIPHIFPALPEAQKAALKSQVKLPVLYTNVLIKNWQAWKKMGIGAIYSPSAFHVHSFLNFPVSLGGYQFAKSEHEPVIIQMQHFPTLNVTAVEPRQRNRIARYELLNKTFTDIERETRLQLNSMMAEGGFDAATDILGITVNRWSHGYSYLYDSLTETMYDDWNDPRYPHMIARKQYKNISIANSDSNAIALLEDAIEQGFRAANEQI